MLKKFISRYHFIIYIGLSFYIMDLYLRYLNLDINFGSMIALTASFFTLAWVSFFISIFLFLNYKKGKFFYLFIISFFALFFIINYFYFMVFNNFFSFRYLALAKEGINYFLSVYQFISFSFFLVLLIFISFVYLGIRFRPKNKLKSDFVLAIFFLLLAIVSFNGGRYYLGCGADNLAFDAWNYKRNIYDTFLENRKSMQVSGFFEYIGRDLYLTYFPRIKEDQEMIKFLDNYYDNHPNLKENNQWTSLFKDKNLILIMLESVDEWLVTKDIMPTVYKMMTEGINFVNHYAPMYGGGATFNSELAANTGFITPFDSGLAAYSYVDNEFPNSLPYLFKEQGYIANMFHLNFGEFYNRRVMAKVFGYENYYGSYDMGISVPEAIKDSHFMTNKKLRNLILPPDKFFSFIITYSVHMPYLKNSLECSRNLNEADKQKINKDEELTCIKAQARETDKLFKLLLKTLTEQSRLDDTVIVAYTDHYAYAFSDKDRLFQYKATDDNNLIQKVPFFIWHNDITAYETAKISSTIDILPTLANLFGLTWEPKNYLGENILADFSKGFVFFSDYSWYDGEIYFKNNKIERGNEVDQSYIDYRNQQITNILKVNKGVFEQNYFKLRKR